jgi:hypothetical protein
MNGSTRRYYWLLMPSLLLWGCTHRPYPSATTTILPTTTPQTITSIANKMAGTRVWHGDHWFDGSDNAFVDDTITIVKVSDTVVAFSFSTNLPMTYIMTDSVHGYAEFIFKWGPPTLYYFYRNDSMSYVCLNGGIHDEQIFMQTP